MDIKQCMILALGLLIAGCVPFSNVKPVDDDIWVSIAFDRGGKNDEIVAKIDKDTFNKLTSGKFRQGWLEIKTAYWSNNCNEWQPVEVAGSKWGYSNDYILKIENIGRIIPLSKKAITTLEQTDKNKEEPSQCN